ncbi:nucleic acid binding [Mactra antiquata]
MGVIRGTSDWLGYNIPDDMEHILEPVTSSDNDSLVNEPVTPQRRRPRAKPQTVEMSVSDHISSRRKGQKQARRGDNLKELINMVEKEDLELDFNIFEPSFSAFAELFNEREKMNAWNDFVNSSEEEQMEILNGKPHDNNQDDNKHVNTDSDSDLDDSWVHVEDKRSAHPSFCADECFLKIDKKIRTMLKRRNRPMGMLVHLEDELIGFFKECPQSVFISRLSSSYERMMLHALCQYLTLSSKSYDSDGVRQTHVENHLPKFNPPPILLSQHLEQTNSVS